MDTVSDAKGDDEEPTVVAGAENDNENANYFGKSDFYKGWVESTLEGASIVIVPTSDNEKMSMRGRWTVSTL